jgi:predicted secreted Zn-dependent protease
VSRDIVEEATADIARLEEREGKRAAVKAIQRHPLTEFFRSVGAGCKPTAAEVDEIAQAVIENCESPAMSYAELRRRIADASSRIIRDFEAGQMGDARRDAREIGASLAERFVDYVEPPSEASQEMDPRKLAAMVLDRH